MSFICYNLHGFSANLKNKEEEEEEKTDDTVVPQAKDMQVSKNKNKQTYDLKVA